MATERVTFAARYDHTWPSKAMTNYPAGWAGSVKTEVANAARALGVLADDALPTDREGLERLAADEGVDVAAIEGTGSRGHVKNEDIAAAILANRAPATLPGNLPADLAEPSALNPALHDGGNSA